MLSKIASLFCVAILWGATNPLIKRGSKGIEAVKADSVPKQFLLELKYLATNIYYLLPMALNQLGSVLYFLTLQSIDLSIAVPVANSLTFIFTAVSGWFLKEQIPSKNTYIGMSLVLMGTTLCCYDNYRRQMHLNDSENIDILS